MNEAEKLALIASIKEAINERIKAAGIDDPAFISVLSSRLHAVEQMLADPNGAGRAANVPGQGLRNPFEADAFKQRIKQLVDGQPTSGRVALQGVGIKHLKALTTLPAGGTSGFPTQAQRGETIAPPVVPLTLVDVLDSIPVTSDTYEAVQLSRTSNAGVQESEGDTKNETEFDANLIDCKIATIAHHTSASRQVLSDNALLGTLLSAILGVDVLAKYENLLLSGNGTTDKIAGLVPNAIPFVHSKPHAPDRISECLSAMWVNGFVGSVVVMHPNDWSDFETERADDEGQDGHYVAGGWSNPASPSLWRVPVARAAGLSQGSALVIDRRYVKLLDRQQVTTMVSTEHADYMVKNLLLMLCEMRGGLYVMNTEAVQIVELTGT